MVSFIEIYLSIPETGEKMHPRVLIWLHVVSL